MKAVLYTAILVYFSLISVATSSGGTQLSDDIRRECDRLTRVKNYTTYTLRPIESQACFNRSMDIIVHRNLLISETRLNEAKVERLELLNRHHRHRQIRGGYID